MRNQQRLTNRPYLTILTVLAILGFVLGCNKINEIVKKAANKDSKPPVTRETPSENGGSSDESGDTLVKKTNYYISDCYNRYSNRVVDSHNRYASWVKNLDQGPTGKESIVYGLYDVTGDGSDCETAVSSAKALDPSMPELEDAADKYVAALKDVIGEIRGIYTYYEQEDYKDDNFAKGKAAHAGLMESFKAFKEANAIFAAEVDKLEDEVAEKELARMKDAGNTADALIVETGIKAKKIKNVLQEKEFEQISADELNPLIEDFNKTVDELKADKTKTMASMYTSACDDFTKAAKEMMRRIRDKKPFSNTERQFISTGAGWMVEGSPAKVIKAYNDMISRRGMTRF
jgi:hypothetical protein